MIIAMRCMQLFDRSSSTLGCVRVCVRVCIIIEFLYTKQLLVYTKVWQNSDTNVLRLITTVAWLLTTVAWILTMVNLPWIQMVSLLEPNLSAIP